ncbi:hypothetical protein [Streptomyces yaizuensis]|uniref:LapA family protein n=1 Tax=Streptomyces yaizuensis TaxID=2989713 RepID=A0ABQ5P9Y7_9ACTN|nr:hypothetical protein [Streptomyces sp. YSPA8]GLF99305.1 LapA family protein [Streptomyces sp. YSPA8]
MSALPLALLLTTAAATVAGVAAVRSVRGLREQLAALRSELARATGSGALPLVPHARATPAAEIRAAVAEALAEERERELAEARAFWAAQEARDAAETPVAPVPLLGGGAGTEVPLDDLAVYVPRQTDFVGFDSLDLEPVDALDALDSLDELDGPDRRDDAAGPATALPEADGESPELAAARRRHPSHPDFVPGPSPVISDHERTVTRLEALAEARTELADVRPGPLGTLDVYVFADGTTLCMTPGHRETAERLAESLRRGETPVLLGGSSISGAYALTFVCGEEAVYILADRVVVSL